MERVFPKRMSDVSICFNRSGSHIGCLWLSANSLQSKFKVTINLILGAMNNIFHIVICQVVLSSSPSFSCSVVVRSSYIIQFVHADNTHINSSASAPLNTTNIAGGDHGWAGIIIFRCTNVVFWPFFARCRNATRHLACGMDIILSNFATLPNPSGRDTSCATGRSRVLRLLADNLVTWIRHWSLYVFFSVVLLDRYTRQFPKCVLLS